MLFLRLGKAVNTMNNTLLSWIYILVGGSDDKQIYNIIHCTLMNIVHKIN